jgi:membrane associated rhomboid family serine protease
MSDPTAAVPVCYRHPDRETGIRCQRCERPICPDCMTPASVGFQCPSCVKEGAKGTRSGRLPYGGEVSSNAALTTFVLIAINVAVWLLIRSDNGIGGWGDKLELLPQTTLFQDNTGVVDLVKGVSDGAWWQVVTSVFAHVEVSHIAFNMIALYFLGPQLELILGRARFLGLYLISGLAGSAAVMLLSGPHTQTLGASGAIFGLLGALLVVAIKLRADLNQILVWLGINVAFTVYAHNSVSWQGHLGGLVGGTILAAIVVYSPKGPKRSTIQWAGMGAVALVSIALIAVRAAALS